MSVTWLICLAILLVIPVVLVYAGYMRQNHCNNLGAKFGYTTRLSLTSPESWAHAQKACPVRYIVAGAALAVFAVLMMLGAQGVSSLSMCIFAGTILLVELMVWEFIVISVESGLRALLGVKVQD